MSSFKFLKFSHQKQSRGKGIVLSFSPPRANTMSKYQGENRVKEWLVFLINFKFFDKFQDDVEIECMHMRLCVGKI